MNDIPRLTLAAIAGLFTIQACGLLNLLLGALLNRWNAPLLELIVSFSLGPLAAQLALCCAAGLIARVTRRVLLIE